MHGPWIASFLWISLLSSLALTWYGFRGAQHSRWWAFLLASVLSGCFTLGAISIALLIGMLPLLQLGWALSAIPGLRSWSGSIFGAGAWALWVSLTLTHVI